LVTGIVIPVTSASWNASRPIARVLTWPVIATTAAESIIASVMPVIKFVAPGPEVAMQTPTLPVTR